MPTYSITPMGTARLEVLEQRAEMLRSALSQTEGAYDEDTYPSQRHYRSLPQVKAWSNFILKYGRQLRVLQALQEHGPLGHEKFYWNREYPLQEGYIRVHNQAKDKAIRELLQSGHIEQTGG